ncbi:MAG: hypothetical protein AAFO91_20400 [Bacteroidota bacterium]
MRHNLLLVFCHVEALFVLLTTLEPATSNPISGAARASVVSFARFFVVSLFVVLGA